VPITVILALALTTGRHPKNGSGDHQHTAAPLPAVTVAAPPTPNPATESACVKVFAGLPVRLGDLAPRRTETDSSFVAAWGDPAVVLRCGVRRPTELMPQSAELVIRVDNVDWLPHQTVDSTVFTAIDRSVYVELTVPKKQTAPPLPQVSDAVAGLPAVCESQNEQGTVPAGKLCTNRA
jgi:hypothetical protein